MQPKFSSWPQLLQLSQAATKTIVSVFWVGSRCGIISASVHWQLLLVRRAAWLQGGNIWVPPGQMKRNSWWLCVSEETHGTLQSQDRSIWRISRSKLGRKRQCWWSFSSSSHIIYCIAIAIVCDKNIRYLIKKTPGQGQEESQQYNKLRHFRKWSAHDTQAIFSMALICWQSWIQPMNGAIDGVLALLLSCAQHNTTTDGGLNAVKHHSYGITCW